MAKKAFVTVANQPSIASGLFRISFTVTFLDSSAPSEATYGDNVDVSVGLLDSVRIQVRDRVKTFASAELGWTLSNDDVFLPDWSRELI